MFLFIKVIEWWDKKKAREPGSIDWEQARLDREARERVHRKQIWAWEKELRDKKNPNDVSRETPKNP
jgi:hypothetical protein